MPETSPRRRLPRWLRILAWVVVVLVVLMGGGLLWLRGRLAASLPQLDGERALPGLSAPVKVERDALGVPTIRGANRLDVARGLGFVHAQDRFFQMDLLRRRAAGELAALLGPPLVPTDRQNRIHRFRQVARASLAAAAPAERQLLDAYTQGVNAGLAALGERPFEYVLLRLKPEPWKPEDTLLVHFAMYLELNDWSGSEEAELARLQETLPPAMFAFVAPRGTEWDAPLEGGPVAPAPIPGPEVFDLRHRPAPPPASRLPEAPRAASLAPEAVLQFEQDLTTAPAGSNNFAVAGSHTADGKALLANDMHLGLAVPNTWYRASMAWPGPSGERRLTGVTLAGTPILVTGSTGRVAWGFTNSYVDWVDLIDLEIDPKDPEVYRTPTGPQRFQHLQETLAVQGGAPVVLDVKETIWGPVLPAEEGRANAKPRAVAWIAHHPEASNLKILAIEEASTLEEAVAVAHRSGIPPQNFTVADSTGRIGWTVIGQLPRRVGFDGRTPTSWADGTRRWDGWLSPDEVPTILDPPSGRIWTANARTLEGEHLARVGDGGYYLGARARQIRDDLLALEKAKPTDLLAVQLDDRALFQERWKGLLLETLNERALANSPDRRELKRLVETTWTGRASVDSVAYRAVRGFHDLTRYTVFAGLLGLPAPKPGARVEISPPGQFEAPLWRLVRERPAHLLPAGAKSWDDLLLGVADQVIALWKSLGPNFADRTWGERNVTRIQHPFSLGIPQAGRFLDMPGRSLPGDDNMPRFQGPSFGASERFVVSPGHEETGIFHMPVGESGHFLSPHYGDGHRAWEEGKPTPFLPGPVVNTLTLRPGR